MRITRLLAAACGLAATFSLVAAGFAGAAPVSGAIFTTDEGCNRVDANIYAERSFVHLNGGPSRAGTAGMPDGSYFVRVTEPNGFLLGSSPTAAVSVVNGKFAACYRVWDIVVKASDGSTGYDFTRNPGGEYKAWASKDADFKNSLSKTDNFKVHGGEEIPL